MADSGDWDFKWGKEEFGGIARAYTTIVENKELKKWKIKKGTVLEAGCGLGRNLLYMVEDNVKLIGVDYSANAVKKAKKIFKEKGVKAKFLLADIRKLPFKNNSIDLVFNQGVIEHFSKPKEPIKEMIRISKKRIIIMVPNILSWDGLISFILKGLSKFGLYDYETRFPYGWRVYFTKKSLCCLLNKLNCNVVYAKNLGIVPVLPIPAKLVPVFIIKLLLSLERFPLPKREIFVVAQKEG